MEQRTIRVMGKGSLRLKPDMTRLTLTLEGTFPDYEEAMRRSAEDTENLRDQLASLGFARSDLKTLAFNVNTEYENYMDQNNVYRQRFVGYKYSHAMKVEFASDNELLGKTLYALAHAASHPEFHIAYFVKDREAAEAELLENAVAVAKQKAAVLSKAAGVTLKDIITVDYSWKQISFETHPVNGMFTADGGGVLAAKRAESYDMSVEPDDIEVTDSVTVVWEID